MRNYYSMENEQNKNCKLLVESADRGDLETIKLLIEKEKVDVHSTNEYGYTALHQAARKGHLEIVKYLMVNGVNIETKVHINNPATALLFAVWKGHTEVAEVLLQQGANKDVLLDGHSILDKSIASNNPGTINLVLNSGFDINCYSAKNGLPPLSFALVLKNFDSVIFLLENGADHGRHCLEKKCSPLHYSAYPSYTDEKKQKSDKFIKFLLDHVKKREGEEGMMDYINYNDTIKGWTALHQACYSRNYSAAKTLLEYGANTNIKDKKGQTPANLLHRLDNSHVCNQIRALLQSNEQELSR